MSSKHKKAISLTQRLKLVNQFDNLKKHRDKQELLKRAGVIEAAKQIKTLAI